MTKKDYFTQILANYALTTEEQAFIRHEIELLENRANREKKPTAAQLMNASIKSAIHAAMETDRLYTVTEVIKEVAECNGFTNQRASALMNQMVEEGTLDKVVEKRRSYFRKVTK
jgi:5-carboxymethyl-2-hydroxymuconate isomerase